MSLYLSWTNNFFHSKIVAVKNCGYSVGILNSFSNANLYIYHHVAIRGVRWITPDTAERVFSLIGGRPKMAYNG